MLLSLILDNTLRAALSHYGSRRRCPPRVMCWRTLRRRTRTSGDRQMRRHFDHEKVDVYQLELREEPREEEFEDDDKNDNEHKNSTARSQTRYDHMDSECLDLMHR